MKRKISLLLSCFACVCMFVYGVLPVQAATCPHTECRVYAIPIRTGYMTFNASGHNVEYGTEHTCVSCGYRFFTGNFYEFEEHQWNNSAWHLDVDEEGNEFFYTNCTTSGCGFIQVRKYY